MRLRDKLHYLAQAGVDVVIVAKFDRTLLIFLQNNLLKIGLFAN